jgi:hypothetical protein
MSAPTDRTNLDALLAEAKAWLVVACTVTRSDKPEVMVARLISALEAAREDKSALELARHDLAIYRRLNLRSNLPPQNKTGPMY